MKNELPYHLLTPQNPFEQIAADAEAARLAKKARRRVVTDESQAPMVPRGEEKKLYEQSAQFRLYERWRREKRDAVVERVGELKILLDNLTPDDAQNFVAWFRSRDWSGFDYAMRQDILAVVGDAIATMRIRHGMPPMDDSLPGEPPRVFEVIRKILTGVGHHD